jgi:hypothetical protein
MAALARCTCPSCCLASDAYVQTMLMHASNVSERDEEQSPGIRTCLHVIARKERGLSIYFVLTPGCIRRNQRNQIARRYSHIYKVACGPERCVPVALTTHSTTMTRCTQSSKVFTLMDPLLNVIGCDISAASAGGCCHGHYLWLSPPALVARLPFVLTHFEGRCPEVKGAVASGQIQKCLTRMNGRGTASVHNCIRNTISRAELYSNGILRRRRTCR